MVLAQRARSRAFLERLPAAQGRLDLAVRVVVRLGFALVGWRVKAEGLERLPRDRSGRVVPCVIAGAPHRGWIDPFPLLLAWPGDAPRLAWIGDARTMARARWRRWLLPRLGMIPIPPVASRETLFEHLADARTILGRGCCLVIFPETGPPSPRGSTRTISPGAAWLAAVGEVPLVPVALGGFLETGLGTRFRLRMLEPLAPPRGDPATREGARAARATTNALREALAPHVADLEEWSAGENGRRPLPALRYLFR